MTLWSRAIKCDSLEELSYGFCNIWYSWSSLEMLKYPRVCHISGLANLRPLNLSETKRLMWCLHVSTQVPLTTTRSLETRNTDSKTNQTDSKDSQWQDHFDKVICFYVYVRPKSPWALPLHPNCIGNLGVVPLKDESLVELNACENWKSWHCHFIHQYQSIRIYANLWFYHSSWSKPFLISYPSLSHQWTTLQLKYCLLFPNVFQLVIQPWFPIVPFGSPDVVYGFFAGSPGGGGIICEEKLRLGSATASRRSTGRWRTSRRRIEAWTRSIGSDGRLPESYQTLRSSAQKTSGLWRILKQSSDLFKKREARGESCGKGRKE